MVLGHLAPAYLNMLTTVLMVADIRLRSNMSPFSGPPVVLINKFANTRRTALAVSPGGEIMEALNQFKIDFYFWGYHSLLSSPFRVI